jgi:hypothetical protein
VDVDQKLRGFSILSKVWFFYASFKV